MQQGFIGDAPCPLRLCDHSHKPRTHWLALSRIPRSTPQLFRSICAITTCALIRQNGSRQVAVRQSIVVPGKAASHPTKPSKPSKPTAKAGAFFLREVRRIRGRVGDYAPAAARPVTHGSVPGAAAAYGYRQGADGGRQCQRGAQRDPAILRGSMQCGDRSALCQGFRAAGAGSISEENQRRRSK